PEFTMLEFYWAYSDYRQLMDLTEELLTALARECLERSVIEWQGTEIDLANRFQRFTMKEAISHFGGVSPQRLEERQTVGEELAQRGADPAEAGESYGHRLAALFELVAEEHLIQPTFILDFPVEISPLAKQAVSDPRFTERFELYVGGMEVANAFSELNDPEVQAQRFREQLEARDSGDLEAHRFDADYIRALEFGMPPAGGEGIGIDRLTMLLTDRASIRDVILFPLLRPESEDT
ncbi:MAG TPA: amino acid--tRNA ligase-related protein, partial [Thermoanaerobaculia bacterium]|nr:amino acid--tRNA ligase-related protein [Thermoanaerobaculia bacterium]